MGGRLSSLLRRVIIRFDHFLSRVEQVYEFTTDPDCILRLSRTESHQTIDLTPGKIGPGDRILEIHLWNERIPIVTTEDQSLAWGTQVLHLFILSLGLVAGQLEENPELSQVKAVRAEMIFLGTADNPTRARQMERLGFTVIPHRSKLGAFGEFWENFYSWWIMWAYNPVSTRNRSLVGNKRLEMWIERERFIEKFGKD